ncbi:MAG: peptide chain release factor N(5)-glutamine methyltransferase [Endomicrobium sp.]|jgi:release factor glutamine methyltransferase|nr:peptide chain release factor N(5)-glutamine methyltransferase [Endomicrobium sp.]
MKVYDILNAAKKKLIEKKIDDYKSSAEVLLSAVLKVKRSKLALIRDIELAEEEKFLFNQYIQRRAKREPTAYILGSCEFMGFEFKVNENVLIPRQETELLVEEALAFCKGISEPKALDLCAGCGCIAISLSKLGSFKDICASDISAQALDVAKENAKLNGAQNINFIQSDIFASFENKKFDIIVSNPPYVSQTEYETAEPELKYEPQIALTTGEDGLFFYIQIASQAKKYLNSGGQIFLELNANKSKEIKSIFENAGYKNMRVVKDYCGLDRILICERKVIAC